MNRDILRDVAERVTALGYPATVEYPGFVGVTVGSNHAAFGTANPNWGGDLSTPDGRALAAEDLNFGGLIPSTSTDVRAIAYGIVDVLNRWQHDTAQ